MVGSCTHTNTLPEVEVSTEAPPSLDTATVPGLECLHPGACIPQTAPASVKLNPSYSAERLYDLENLSKTARLQVWQVHMSDYHNLRIILFADQTVWHWDLGPSLRRGYGGQILPDGEQQETLALQGRNHKVYTSSHTGADSFFDLEDLSAQDGDSNGFSLHLLHDPAERCFKVEVLPCHWTRAEPEPGEDPAALFHFVREYRLQLSVPPAK